MTAMRPRPPSIGLSALVAALLVVGCLGLAGRARAVEPGEMLPDHAMEARARTISEGLRCLVCQNESIDDSHAELARDIRLLVRQRLQAGDSNQAVRDYLTARYGAFILLKPPFDLQTLLLWGTPLIVLVGGGIGLFVARSRTRVAAAPKPLDENERRQLDDILSRHAG